jgi:SAM-dependent methyltransferase
MRTFSPSAANNGQIVIRFPDGSGGLDQDQEWFEVQSEGRCRRLRIHDYAALYTEPGLYEMLVYDALQCKSPRRIVNLLKAVLEDRPAALPGLRVLDLGAGNGIVAERLRAAGVRSAVGLDLIPEAAAAALRDRPGVYDDYVVADLTDLGAADRERLRSRAFNCLVTVAALGFGDVPPEAFAEACNLIADGGWVAMTIKEDFLDPEDRGGFGRLVRRMIAHRVVEVHAHHRYCHRVSIAGERLFYVALVARKLRPVPDWMARGDAAPEGAANRAGGYAATFLRK